jgi:CBS domain containing-hemolysin-like protein
VLFLQSFLFVFLFGLSMLFSAAEAALTALSTLRMKRLSVERPSLTPALSEWITHPHRLLTTLLVGNNFVNVAASSLFYTMLLPVRTVLPPRVFDALMWLSATALFVAGAEIIPKIIGRAYRDRICAWGLPVLARMKDGLFFIWGPVGWALGKAAPRFAVAPANPLMVTSLEDLHHALTESESQGDVPPDAAAMIRRAVQLPERTAGQIMQPAVKVDGLSLDLLGGRRPPDFYVDVLIEAGRTRLPVFKKGEPVGYVNALDLMAVEAAPPLEKILRPLRRVRPEEKVLDLLHTFKSSGDPIAAVQDGDRFLGLVTLEDVLEEVVGEILDEYDLEQKK